MSGKFCFRKLITGKIFLFFPGIFFGKVILENLLWKINSGKKALG